MFLVLQWESETSTSIDSRKGNSKENELVYFEKDETFYTNVSKSKSKKYIIISSYSTLTSEFQFLSADNPNDNFTLFSINSIKF